jgi:hypothetical protein
MKCSNPQCNHGIGLVSYRRAFAKGRYCSKKCRNSYVIERAKPAIPGRAATTYFEWLFLQPGGNAAVPRSGLYRGAQ